MFRFLFLLHSCSTVVYLFQSTLYLFAGRDGLHLSFSPWSFPFILSPSFHYILFCISLFPVPYLFHWILFNFVVTNTSPLPFPFPPPPPHTLILGFTSSFISFGHSYVPFRSLSVFLRSSFISFSSSFLLCRVAVVLFQLTFLSANVIYLTIKKC